MARLPASWTDHFRQGPSLRVGSSTREGQPELATAHAAQVLDDGRVELLLFSHASADLLAAIRATGRVAVSAGLPNTSRVLHLKGQDAQVQQPREEHAGLLATCLETWLRQIEVFGADRRKILAVLGELSVDRLSCVSFTPLGAWDQTPGPGAGQVIELLP